MNLDTLWPASWLGPGNGRGTLAALAAALVWAGLLRLLNRRDLAALGTGLGLAAGWWLTLGLPVASPRQLAERLPLLALVGFAAALPLTLLANRTWSLALGAGLLLAAGAWWLAGAPVTVADVRRALVPVLALGALAAVASLELRSPLRAAVAFGLLLAAVWIARPTGPWLMLASAGVAASLGCLPAGTPWTAAAAAPVALALAGVAAGPVIARGGAADWVAGAVPFAALLLGPALAARLGGRAGAAIGWAVAGGVPLLITWLLARGA